MQRDLQSGMAASTCTEMALRLQDMVDVGCQPTYAAVVSACQHIHLYMTIEAGVMKWRISLIVGCRRFLRTGKAPQGAMHLTQSSSRDLTRTDFK